jgi:predicted CoA-substrate-specific enzyme activase
MGALAAIGLDAGSTTCKVAAVAADGALLASRIAPAQPRVAEQAAALVAEVAAEVGGGPAPLVATGYGRKLVRGASKTLTEITCHARGVFRALGRTGTLVDVGGQDSKVIVIGAKGRAVDFAMNDKCAAGTGRFLEHTAARLDVALADLGPRALAAGREEAISSTCTVFAESEIIGLVARGADVDPILRGLHRSLVARLVAMVRGVGLVPPLMLSGGVARNAALAALLGEALGTPVLVPDAPQLMGAYGAALVGLDA